MRIGRNGLIPCYSHNIAFKYKLKLWHLYFALFQKAFLFQCGKSGIRIVVSNGMMSKSFPDVSQSVSVVMVCSSSYALIKITVPGFNLFKK